MRRRSASGQPRTAERGSFGVGALPLELAGAVGHSVSQGADAQGEGGNFAENGFTHAELGATAAV